VLKVLKVLEVLEVLEVLGVLNVLKVRGTNWRWSTKNWVAIVSSFDFRPAP